METISNALFWISNGLLVPGGSSVVTILCACCTACRRFFGEFYRRVHTQKSLAEQLEELTPDNIEEKANSLTGDRSTPLQRCVYKLYTHRDNAAYCERLLANFEVDAEQELGRSRTFVKLGPMLGLMGTLIPMGPALVGLAQETLLQWPTICKLAFATTVVGMVIAAIEWSPCKSGNVGMP